jgi:hypothetical protein
MIGAEGGTRTRTPLRSTDFKPVASAIPPRIFKNQRRCTVERVIATIAWHANTNSATIAALSELDSLEAGLFPAGSQHIRKAASKHTGFPGARSGRYEIRSKIALIFLLSRSRLRLFQNRCNLRNLWIQLQKQIQIKLIHSTEPQIDHSPL